MVGVGVGVVVLPAELVEGVGTTRTPAARKGPNAPRVTHGTTSLLRGMIVNRTTYCQ